MTSDVRTSLSRLAGLGWNSSVPPNGFANRRAVAEDPYNDNPLGLATPVGRDRDRDDA